MIISILNQKGGVGKTTLSTHIAGQLALAGQTVRLVDADTQHSALDWAAARDNSGLPRLFSVVGYPKGPIHKEMPDLARGFDHVVIDGPPRTSTMTPGAIMAADVVVIPVQPSPYDVWAAADVVTMIEEARTIKENLKAFFLVNRKIVNTVIGRDVYQALGEHEIPTLNTAIHQRVAFADSAGGGHLVMETDPQGSAAKEIDTLVREILEKGN